MSDAGANRHETPRPMDLPGEADVEAVRRLVQETPQASCRDRARKAADAGLLKDLARCLDRRADREGGPARGLVIEDLGEVIVRFEELAEILGFAPPQDPASGPELAFKDCRIERCDVSYLDIHWPVRIEHSVWSGPVAFVGARFHGPVSFLGCSFLREVNFFASGFDAGAYFGGATFYAVGDFRGASFSGEVSFFRGNFRESLELRYATFDRDAVLNFHELRFQGSTSLGGSLHLHLQELRGGAWPLVRGRIYGERSTRSRDQADACEQYGELEANFAAQGSPDASAARDWCHYRYMDLRRRTRYKRWNPRRALDWLFMKWCFGYGVFTRRILFTAIGVIFLFAATYATNGFGLPEHLWAVEYGSGPGSRLMTHYPWPQRLGNALYFSAVTFATVGYGDWHPLHWAKVAGAVEGVLGVFVMSVFTVSFARKLLR